MEVGSDICAENPISHKLISGFNNPSLAVPLHNLLVFGNLKFRLSLVSNMVPMLLISEAQEVTYRSAQGLFRSFNLESTLFERASSRVDSRLGHSFNDALSVVVHGFVVNRSGTNPLQRNHTHWLPGLENVVPSFDLEFETFKDVSLCVDI